MNNQPDTRRGYNLKLSPSVDGELIQYLDSQPNAMATIKAALYAYMRQQPPQAEPLVQQLSDTLARAEQLLTSLQRVPLQAAPQDCTTEQAVDAAFANAVRGNLRPAFKPKK